MQSNAPQKMHYVSYYATTNATKHWCCPKREVNNKQFSLTRFSPKFGQFCDISRFSRQVVTLWMDKYATFYPNNLQYQCVVTICRRKEIMFLTMSVCLSVCYITQKLINRFWHKNFWRSGEWRKDQSVRFWWRSGSRSGSRNFKSILYLLLGFLQTAKKKYENPQQRFRVSECFPV